MTPVSLLKHPAIFARLSLSDEQLQKIQNRKRYLKKQKAETSSKDELDLLGEGDGDSFTGSDADLESAADNLFTSPPPPPHPHPPTPRPQPLAFSSLSLKTPAKAVPPTPGTVLQNKIQRNLEKSLGDSLNIHIQQQMGSFQASMLEAFQSLREELAVKKPAEVDPSPHASKASPSSNSAAHLDLPPPRSSTNAQSEAMDVDVGPALPPRLVLNQTSSDQYVAPSEAILKDSSYSHKKQSHRQTVAPSSASDQLDEDSDEPRIHPRPKKHSDKSKHKSRSRYVSSSEEDHSPVARHRSSKPSRAQPSGAASDQDLPQHDPDPPYYREVALSDIPSQYSEEVDTFRRILSLPDPRDSMPEDIFKQICRKWFTPHVDLFATHLNHKLPLYVSSIPDPRAWNIDALNINWTNLTAYAYPPTALLHKVIQKIKQCHCLIIVIAPGWPGMPWFWDLVQLSTEIPLQLPVSTTLLKQSHNYVFHNNPQQLNLHAWCLGADNSKNKASLWRWQRELLPLSGHQQGPSTGQSGPYLKNGAEKIRWISPLHL